MQGALAVVRSFWTQKLTQVLRRRWDPSKNSSINWKAAVHSKLATKTDDGSYSLNPEYWLPDVESGRGVNFNSLNEKGREIYLRNLDDALEVQSHSALKNSLGANSLEVTERGTHITYKSKAVDRTAPQGFDALTPVPLFQVASVENESNCRTNMQS